MRLRVISIVALSLAIVGCAYIQGPIKEVEAYGAAIEPFMQELTKTIADDSSAGGVDKVAKLWESKKADLKAKRDAIDAAPQGKNADWMSLLFKINGRIKEYLSGIEGSVIAAPGGYDSPGHQKFKQVRTDIEKTLKLN